MENKNCEQCGVNFQYELKPGFPRKYCPTCSAANKAAFNAKQGVSTTPASTPENPRGDFKPATGNYSPKDLSIISQCLTKCCAEIAKMQPAGEVDLIRKEVLDTYNFFLKEL